MDETFIRRQDDSPIWRLNDEICLTVTRHDMCFDHINIGTDWQKTGDPPYYRRPDDSDLHKQPDYPFWRPNDNSPIPRAPDGDFTRPT